MKIFLVFSIINILFISGVYVTKASTMYNTHSIELLTNALTNINKPKTLKVANSLKNVNINSSTYDLIIRNADLNYEDIKKIANAIELIDLNKGPSLSTISMSFNENLKDKSILLILNSIPKTTKVMACVECGLTDKAAETIIHWAYEAKNLQALYFEGNFFSRKMHEKFIDLTNGKPNLTVLSEWPSEQFKSMVKQTYN